MSAQAVTSPGSTNFKKVLRGLDMTLFTVCAILVIDTLAPSAAIGSASISWWIITLILFFIPYGLITAELGTAYPEQGGLYVWVKRAWVPNLGAFIKAALMVVIGVAAFIYVSRNGVAENAGQN